VNVGATVVPMIASYIHHINHRMTDRRHTSKNVMLIMPSGWTIDNRIIIYLDIRLPINQPYKMLPPEVESARHFDLNITQWELPLVMCHLNSQSRHCRLDEMCVRNCNEISRFFIFLFCKDFYVTYVLM